MIAARSLFLFALAAVAEIGGAWPVWQPVREHRPWRVAGLGVLALGLYGFVATLRPDAHFRYAPRRRHLRPTTLTPRHNPCLVRHVPTGAG
ncbi:hypothetical protein [Embleya sp. NBC_00896]|uniref:hypothetical protein n=1 Tax=Embleya sp. NBC_00896 TaxID=2975961 RepID=UPI003868D3E4|nr:hypothetical protein OG928_02470 [Embleya sp. NBC_00896]